MTDENQSSRFDVAVFGGISLTWAILGVFTPFYKILLPWRPMCIFVCLVYALVAINLLYLRNWARITYVVLHCLVILYAPVILFITRRFMGWFFSPFEEIMTLVSFFFVPLFYSVAAAVHFTRPENKFHN